MTTTLEQLVDQVAALSARVDELAQTPQSDSLQPNYLSVSATGAIGALLTGGVQLLELTDAVQWIDTTGGVREYIQGYLGGGGAHALGLFEFPDVNDLAQIILSATVAGALGSANITASVGDNAGGFAVVELIDSLNRSSFLQLAQGVTEQLRVVRGIVASDATIIAGEGFTAAHTGTGDYTITFLTAFPTLPAVVALPVTSNFLLGIKNLTVNAVELFSVNTVDVSQDVEFCFTAIG